MDPVVHFEMGYLDATRVSEFYTQVFNWKMTTLDEKMGNYVLAASGETDSQGMMQKPGVVNGGFYKTDKILTESTTHIVISVDDIKTSVSKVKSAGGQINSEPMDIPGIGTYVSFLDTEGNSVGMLQPLPMGK